MINALNPNPYIFWGTVGARTLVEGWREAPTVGIAFLAGFYVTAILSTIGIILLFGTARQLGPRITRTLAILSSVVLLGFGFYQLISGVLAIF
jgi:threonine/homoserine/homoserine lactone efflux protein